MHENLSQMWDYIDSLALYYRYRNTDQGPRPSKEWVKEQLLSKSAGTDRHNGEVSPLPRQGVGDKGAGRQRPWTAPGYSATNQPMDTGSSQTTKDSLTLPNVYQNVWGHCVNTYPQLYKITANEFRRLSDQVKEVNHGINNRFKGVTYKRLYGAQGEFSRSGVKGHPASDGSLYHSQLASSLKAFHDKERVPYEPEGSLDISQAPRVRPGTAPPGRSSRHISCRLGRPNTPLRTTIAAAPPRPRPKSSPPARDQDLKVDVFGLTTSSSSIAEDTADGFDNLTPDIAFELSDGIQPESLYGDKPDSTLEGIEDRSVEEYTESGDVINRNDDENDEAGIDKENSDDDSDEDYPEPKVEEIKLKHVPDLNLRPEKVDSLYIPELQKGDRRKYDFDVGNTEIPVYEFATPLSEELWSLDLKEALGQNGASVTSWREKTEHVPVDEVEDAIMNRLATMCQLGLRTQEWEEAKREKARLARQRQNARNRIGGASRLHIAKGWKEKRCCMDCLQLLCVGDCPNKRPPGSPTCSKCQERDCNGRCSEMSYDIRSRKERDSNAPDIFEEKGPVKPAHHTSCTSCQTRHNAKLINANHIVMGRPRSAMATYTRGQNSTKPKDMRPKSGNVTLNRDLENQFTKLGMEPYIKEKVAKEENEAPPERPDTACSNANRKLRGRSAVSPHKSYFSQRRLSITGNDYTRERMRTAAMFRRRIKSAKTRKRTKTPTIPDSQN